MKKLILFLVCVTLFEISTFCQEKDSINNLKHDISFGLSAFYSPVLSMNLFGLENTFKYYFKKRLATGYSISIAEKKFDETFNYEIQEPILGHYEFGWLNQYDLLVAKRMRVGAYINNGLLIARLADNAIQEEYCTTYGPMKKAKEIATNYFYFLEPGLNTSLLVFSKERWPSFHLTLDARYRFAFGNTEYAKTSDFMNYYISLGLAISSF